MRVNRQKVPFRYYLRNEKYSPERYIVIEEAVRDLSCSTVLLEIESDGAALDEKLRFLRAMGINSIWKGKKLEIIPENNESVYKKFSYKHISQAVRDSRIEALRYLNKYGGDFVKDLSRNEIVFGKQLSFKFERFFECNCKSFGDARDKRDVIIFYR